MKLARWIILAAAVLEFGWLTGDGSRALLVGDYVTPTSGPYAGQLGPWAHVVSAVGVEPRSTLMKCVHLGLGVGGLMAAAGFALRRRRAWSALFVAALLGLWYLPVGTLLGVIQVGLLLLPAVRKPAA